MNSALEGGEWSAARPGRTLPRERPGTHFTVGWAGTRTALDGRKISSPPGFDPRTVQLVAQSLYRLSYRTNILILYYNHKGPPSYMRSVVDRNVVTQRGIVFGTQFADSEEAERHVPEKSAAQNHAGRTRYVRGISNSASSCLSIPSTCVDPAASALVAGKSPCLCNKVT